MRILLPFVILLILTGSIFTINKPFAQFKTPQEALKEIMEEAPSKTYHNDFYGYNLNYPEVFQYDTAPTDSLLRLAYHNHERFVIECEVLTDREMTPIKKMMEQTGTKLHAQQYTLLTDSFTLTGPLFENGEPIAGYSYHCKYVRKQKLWFTYTLYYPTAYKDSVSSILFSIDQWKAIA